MKAQRKRWMTAALAVRHVGTIAVVTLVAWALGGSAQGATVYWTNTDATATWTAPDSAHFSTAKIGSPGSPATYNNGDTVQFGNGWGGSLPSTPSTLSIAAGGVSPATINMYSPRYVNTYTFNIGEDNALGSGSFDTDYQVSTTFNNTKGSEVTVANNFVYANFYSLVFSGGDFRLSGTLSGGGNNGLNLKPAGGVTVIVANAISGSGNFSVKPSGVGGVVRLNGSSSCWLYDANADVTIQVGADNALGPSAPLASQQSDVRASTKLEAVSSVTLSNNFTSRGMSVICTADLALNGLFGALGNGYISVYKYGSSTLTLGGTNGTTHYGAVSIREGVVRLSKADALGISPVILSGGVLELGAADFTNTLNTSPQYTDGNTVGWINAGGSYGGSGGFSAYGANRFVNLGGTNAVVTWGSGGFVPSGQTLIFGSSNANAQLDFQNPINLGGSVRTIRVNDNTNSTADRAVLSGVISGTAGNGLLKTGNGTLFFNATNTYSGATTNSAGFIGGNGKLSGNLVFGAGSGFVADWNALNAPLAVGGSVDLSNADTLTVLGTPPSKTRSVILTVSGGINGTFDTVTGLASGWSVDYSVAGEVALKPPSGGTVIAIQ